MATKYKRAFGLIRVSSSAQDLEQQKKVLMTEAKKAGYVIEDEEEGHDFFSEKITGYDEDYDYDRKSIVDLKRAITIEKPSAIFIVELSRLTRTAIKVSKYITELSLNPKIPMYFVDYKIWTINPEDGKINHNGVLKLIGGAEGVELERKRIKERTSRGRNIKGEQGYYIGHLKDGYMWKYDEDGEKVIKIDEERAPVIKKIFELYLKDGMSTGGIRDYLNAEGIPTTNRYRLEHPTLFKGYRKDYYDRTHNVLLRENTLWRDGMVSNILRDEWYRGIRRFHGEEYPVDAIIEDEVFDNVENKLKQYRMRISTAKQTYLLQGLLFCGVCGRKLYGHSDGGYNDMYYCSSYSYGKAQKCGLKWVRRQNLDSIITSVVNNRVYEDVSMGINSPFSKFFDVDETKLSELNERQNTYQKLIEKTKEDIQTLESRIDNYVSLQGQYTGNKRMIERYSAMIDETEKAILKKEDEIIEYEITISQLKKKKKILSSVSEKLIEVKDVQDYERMRLLIQSVVEKILLYNPDNQTTIIKILYVNGKSDILVYNPTRLTKKFLFLTRDDKEITPYVKYDEVRKKLVFDGYYFAINGGIQFVFDDKDMSDEEWEAAASSEVWDEEIQDLRQRAPLGRWDTPHNRERYLKLQKERGVSEEDAMSNYEIALEYGLIHKDLESEINYYISKGYFVSKDEMSVRDYIEASRQGEIAVEYNDLLPLSERGKKRKEYYQHYWKQHNTGKPSFTPFVVKDVDYEKICKERKHLYNRKYKILNNKSLTQEQKDKKIFEIMEKLEAYKYQLKYLPNNKKGEMMIEKYNKKPKEE